MRDGQRVIPLYRGGEVVAHAVVDEVDHEWLSSVRWNLDRKGYARRSKRVGAKVVTVLLHREVFECEGFFVDHINRDPLDCRRANLRLASHAENAQNVKVRGESDFRGVTRAGERWRARGMVAGRSVHLGYFDSEAEAAEAATAWRIEHLPFAEVTQ